VHEVTGEGGGINRHPRPEQHHAVPTPMCRYPKVPGHSTSVSIKRQVNGDSQPSAARRQASNAV